jgi:D-serine deaminase-like pyridoxal phosphate-dependent protein
MDAADPVDRRVAELARRWDGAVSLLAATEDVVTPALVIDGDAVEHNTAAVIDWLGDAGRWRPHVKTTKLQWAVGRLLARGVRSFKCATTLELRMLLDAGAPDVMLAMCARGANARAVRDLAARGQTAVSVLVEGDADLDEWADAPVGAFIDVDTGMGRSACRSRIPGRSSRLRARSPHAAFASPGCTHTKATTVPRRRWSAASVALPPWPGRSTRPAWRCQR